MEIRVHVKDGEEFSFVQKDEELIDRILSTINPFRLFQREQIVIQGATTTIGFSAKSIECIEFLTDRKLDWPSAGGLEDVVSLSEESFSMESERRAGQDMRKVQIAVKKGDIVDGLGIYVMESGKRFYFIYSIKVHGRLDARKRIQYFLDSWGFPARRESGGYLLINPKNISQWSLHPGPPVAPTDAWYVNRIE